MLTLVISLPHCPVCTRVIVTIYTLISCDHQFSFTLYFFLSPFIRYVTITLFCLQGQWRHCAIFARSMFHCPLLLFIYSIYSCDSILLILSAVMVLCYFFWGRYFIVLLSECGEYIVLISEMRTLSDPASYYAKATPYIPLFENTYQGIIMWIITTVFN